MKLVLIAAGGALGALLRYGATGLVHGRLGFAFPYGTLVVNVAGCLLLGVLMATLDTRWSLPAETRILATVGVLGAFTTFSTFGYETFELLREGSQGVALLNVGANVVLGVAAVAAGRWIVLAIAG